MNSILRSLSCFTLIIHWNNKTYKLFTPLGNRSKASEFMANRSALMSDFWKDRVITVHPHLFGLSMLKGYPVDWDKVQLAEIFIDGKQKEALQYPRSQFRNSYNLQQLQELSKYGVDKLLINQASKQLNFLELPVTSSHGDLHISNMILDNDEIKLIDWTMYNQNGSFITDYIHFYNYIEAVKHNESWTASILREQECIDQMANDLRTTTSLLKLAYTVSRIIGEINQYRSLSLIPQRQISKYNSVLSILVSATSKNQCSV